ncbi:glycosyltransferase [Streptomyces sp. NBC_01426]|uniref:glycosyltransferase family 2 protein n=1 Tax=unclassified Streptomyces TaxID=2593676 RepID=UPI002E351AA0|nr:glycosyltransferase [Streptomyces sp. NBC_01426]
MGSPASVSVVIPVHNTRRYLRRCFDSVAAQTLTADRIEVIAVDDGSTDGSGDWLDAWAARHPNTTVIHQAASGGAGKPRNVGIDASSGDYLFFLDSDDYLGPEALERLVRMAEEQDSDVVYGRIVGINGRAAPVDLRTTSAEVSLHDSPVYWTLAAYKLWRRSLVDAHRLRFAEGRLLGEDLPFGAHALLHARRISVVADHDCYFLEGRGDGTNATEQDVDWVAQLAYVGELLELVADHVPAGRERDKLMERHFHGEVLGMFAEPYLARDEAGREALVRAARPLVEAYLTERISAALPPRLRLRAHLIGAGRTRELTAVVTADTVDELGPAVIEGGRAFAAYPFFRAPDAALPDELYDLTSRVVLRQELASYSWDGPVLRLRGTARLDGMGGAADQEVALLLRRQGHTIRIPAARTDARGGYEAAVDVNRAAEGLRLDDGIWTVRVAVAAGSLVKEAWLPRPKAAEYDAAPVPRIVHGTPGEPPQAATVFHSEAHQHVNLDLGATRIPLAADARGTAAARVVGAPVLEATATIPGWPADAPVDFVLHAPGRAPFTTPAVGGADPDGLLRLRSQVRGVPEGEWQVRLRIRDRGFTRELPVHSADGAALTVRVPLPLHRRLGRHARRTVSRIVRAPAR